MRVTYNEFLSDSASLAGVAINEPVTITEGGQDHLVILSAKEYYRLAKMRRAIRPYELSDEQVAAVEAATMSPEHDHLDCEVAGLIP